MPLYQVRARDKQGELRLPVLEAETQKGAVDAARAQGLYVIEVTPVKPASGPGALSRARLAASPLRPGDQALFFRHLGPLIGAGMSPPLALGKVAARLPEPRLARLATEMGREIAAGAALSQSLANRPGYFPEWVAGTVAAAEEGGKSDELLRAVAEELRQQALFERGYAVPLAYLRASAVLGAIVPTMPFIMSIGWRNWTVLASIVAAVAAVLVYGGAFGKRLLGSRSRKTGSGDSPLALLSGRGRMARALGIARFARVLKSMADSGLPLGEAWGIASLAAGEGVPGAGLAAGRDALTGGQGLGEAVRVSGLFGPSVAEVAARAEGEGRYTDLLEWLVAETGASADRAIAAGRRGMWSTLLLGAGVVIAVCAVVGMLTYALNLGLMMQQLFEEG